MADLEKRFAKFITRNGKRIPPPPGKKAWVIYVDPEKPWPREE